MGQVLLRAISACTSGIAAVTAAVPGLRGSSDRLLWKRDAPRIGPWR
ncbi:MAG: hypothetical protein ACOVME_06210 [Rhodobacter sp.]